MTLLSLVTDLGSSFAADVGSSKVPSLFIPRVALSPKELAVIVNDVDPVSRRVASYYKSRRKIPEKNMIHVSFPTGSKVLSPRQFRILKGQVDALTPTNVQAYALAWTVPFRVGCMSITTAFANGYNRLYCASGCKSTKSNPYFNSVSDRPYHDYDMRPTMMLAGKEYNEVVRLIDRGVASDNTYPQGTAYLLSTSDKARNTRAPVYDAIIKGFKGLWEVQVVDADYLENKTDVMFYFTGLSRVPQLRSNNFLPGAIADHLTSSGGRLTDSSQMSSLRWLEAGATGSYGAVIEPCNFPQKFPNPAIVMASYISGESLIEAYWKSVAWPGQGLFIGEPLAQPFAAKPRSVAPLSDKNK